MRFYEIQYEDEAETIRCVQIENTESIYKSDPMYPQETDPYYVWTAIKKHGSFLKCNHFIMEDLSKKVWFDCRSEIPFALIESTYFYNVEDLLEDCDGLPAYSVIYLECQEKTYESEEVATIKRKLPGAKIYRVDNSSEYQQPHKDESYVYMTVEPVMKLFQKYRMNLKNRMEELYKKRMTGKEITLLSMHLKQKLQCYTDEGLAKIKDEQLQEIYQTV